MAREVNRLHVVPAVPFVVANLHAERAREFASIKLRQKSVQVFLLHLGTLHRSH